MNEILRNLEVRKENLIFLLKNRKDQLELEKQHQIYGAIKEIDYIMRMMSYSDEEVSQGSKMTTQMAENTGVIKKIGERMSSFKNPIRIRFQKNEP
jgi:hypothetical protein